MSALYYYTAFICLFFLPGFLLGYLFNFRRFRFLLSVAFSYVLLVFTLIILQALEAPVEWFLLVMCAETGLLAIVCACKRGWRAYALKKAGGSPFARRGKLKKASATALFIVLVAAAGYMFYAGPYTEITSDGWEHLNRIRRQSKRLNDTAGIFPIRSQRDSAAIVDGCFVMKSSMSDHLLSQGNYWYFIQAVLCNLSGLSVNEAMGPMTYTSMLFFLAGVYYFGLSIFSRFRCSSVKKAAAAAAAALFMGFHLGTSVFAYIRYYAFAPTMLNYILYFAGVLLFLDFLDGRGRSYKNVFALIFIICAANAIHRQEAIFIYFMCMAISLLMCWRLLIRSGYGSPEYRSKRFKSCVCALGSLAVFFALFFILRPNPLHEFAMYDRYIVPIQSVIPFLRGFFVQPPWGQFYETITLWGLFVYLLFIATPSPLKRNRFMLAGMLIPLLTVFNPFAVDMMSRYGRHILHIWRFSYCVPIHFAAGWFAVDSASRIARNRAVFSRLVNSVVLAILIVLLFPFNTRYISNIYSRWYTIRRTAVDNDYHWWGDLVEFMQGVQDRPVISDPVTAYIIGGITENNVEIRKFDSAYGMETLAAADPKSSWEALMQDESISGHGPMILVLNRRDGGPSLNGLLSGHWPWYVLKVSRYYSDESVDYIENNPHLFRLLWEHDRIGVYEIVEE